MTLACSFLGKVLGVGCHYFPSPLDIPTFAARYLHDARDPSSEGWNYGREYCPVNLAEMTTSTPFWDLLHATKHDMGPTALLPLEGRRAEDFFALKIRRLRPGLNPASTLTPRPLKPLHTHIKPCSHTGQ